ncbi:MAG: hypothetical protein ACR2GQ_11210 [Gemmatimonadota bacterium]
MAPRQAARETGVERYDAQQDDGLDRGRVALHFGASLADDQGFADRLDEVVRREDEEDIERQQERREPFSAAYIREQAQETIEHVLRDASFQVRFR